MEVRYFTAAEVNRLIPDLEDIISHLRLLKERVEQELVELRELRARMGGNSDFFAQEAAIDFLTLQARGHILQIQSLGGQLKDVDKGLVDFPAQIGGQEAMLCWAFGEPEVRFWHRANEGFSQRKPLAPGAEEGGGAAGSPAER